LDSRAVVERTVDRRHRRPTRLFELSVFVVGRGDGIGPVHKGTRDRPFPVDQKNELPALVRAIVNAAVDPGVLLVHRPQGIFD
jgi:hypothetical protein